MNNDLCISHGFNLVLFCRTTVFCHNMAHYEQIGRKSVVNSCLRSRKANKINGLLVQGLHRREISAAFLHKLSFTVQTLTFRDHA